MTKVIFVHGAFASKASWFDVPDKAVAPQSGDNDSYSADPITLPHHVPLFPLPLPRLGSLNEYVLAIAGAFPDNEAEKCILVGHSLGGMAISAAAAVFPERIRKLVYVTAVLPQDGKSAEEYLGNPIGLYDDVMRDAEKLTEPQRLQLRTGLASQPMSVFDDPLEGSAGFEAIPKHYVLCHDDSVIPLTTQSAMADGATIYTLNATHFPQITHAKALAEILHEIFEA